MKLMVIGGGGREHAIIRALKQNPRVEAIYALPGNAGMEGDAILVPIGAKDIPAQVEFAKTHGIDFAVVAPDDPLVLGAVDALTEAGIPCFGPKKNAALIEGSKVFAKDLMARYHIPTAACRVFTDLDSALSYAETAPLPQVIKADGLALGKGVIIAETREDAKKALHEMMEDKIFGDSGSQVVMEEFLTGPEVSVLAFTDGKTIKPMVSSMDHKRAHDGDTGLNTGGMGTVAPNPYYTPEIAKVCMDTIFRPTIDAMAKEGRPFAGCLYFGLMLTPQGPKVIEYNCRFGDPGDPGGAAPAGERPADHYGGLCQWHPGSGGGPVRPQARLLRGAGLPGLSHPLREGLSHHPARRAGGQLHLYRRRRPEGRPAGHQRRPGPGGRGRGGYAAPGHRPGLRPGRFHPL